MAVATGTALALSGIAGAGLGFLGSREQRRAAQRAAQIASQPQFFNQTSQSFPTPGTEDYINALLRSSFGAFNSRLPSYPDYVGFGFNPMPTPKIESFDYQPLGVPQIPGASGTSRDILAQIMGLIEGGSPFLQAGEDVLMQLVEGTGNKFVPQAESFLYRSPLSQIAAGRGASPFTDEVISVLQSDAKDLESRMLQDIAAAASGMGRTGGDFQRRAESDAREAVAKELTQQTALQRAGAYESESNRQMSALGMQGNLLQYLAGLRSGEQTAAAGLAPSLEQARFIGPGLASQTSLSIDQLQQAARMFMADFEAQQHGIDAQYAAQAVQDRIFEALFGERQHNLQQQAGMQNAQALNSYNLGRFGFETEEPFFRANQFARILLPFATAFGTTQTSGQNQQNVPPPYTPSPWLGLAQGGLGGYLAGRSLFGNFGQQGYNPYSGTPFAGGFNNQGFYQGGLF